MRAFIMILSLFGVTSAWAGQCPSFEGVYSCSNPESQDPVLISANTTQDNHVPVFIVQGSFYRADGVSYPDRDYKDVNHLTKQSNCEGGVLKVDENGTFLEQGEEVGGYADHLEYKMADANTLLTTEHETITFKDGSAPEESDFNQTCTLVQGTDKKR